MTMDLTPKTKSSRTARTAKRVTGDEKPVQTTLLLTREQHEWITDVCLDARKGGGKPMKMAYLVRALIEEARQRSLSLEGARSEEEVHERVSALLNK